MQILYYICVLLITFIAGIPVLLLVKKEQENWIPKCFLFGTSILIICTYWISYFYDGGLKGLCKFFVLFVMIVAIGVCVMKRERFKSYVRAISRMDILGLLSSIVCGMLPLLLVIIHGAQFPYCDGYTYVCNADYLMDYGYNVPVSPEDTLLHPWLSQTLLYQQENLRIGSQMFLGLISSLFNVKFSLELFMPITAFGVFLCGMASWSFMSSKYAKGSYYKIIAILMVVLNGPIILWNAVYGFLPQTFGSAFCLAAMAQIMQISEWREDAKWHIGTTALLFACNALLYNEILPFLVLVTVVSVVRCIVCSREQSKNVILYISGCAVVAILLIITYVPGIIEATLSQFGSIVGWHQDKDISTYVAYFLSTVPAEYSFRLSSYNAELLCYQIITLFMLCIVAVGFLKADKEIKREFICISLPYGVMFVYFILLTKNPWTGESGNSWSIYKLMQYYFVVAIPYLAIYVAEALKKINRAIIGLAILGFTIFNANQIIDYMENLSYSMENYVGEQESSIQEYYELYEKYGNEEQRIALYDVPEKHRQMITYFLKDVELVSDWNTDVYYTTIPVMSREELGADISLVYDLSDSAHVAGLVERNVTVVPGEGFYGMEVAEDSYWNWSKKESKLYVNKYGDKEPLVLCFETWCMEQDEVETLSICLANGQVLQTVEVYPDTLHRVELEIPFGVCELCLVYSGEAKATVNDPRELAFAIRNYMIREVDGE